ncbi:hypothetical protein [Anaerobiospirillum sp. NML120449]|nr:hypothetical protein [Anaerobiospirillum sp. NML120449]MCK0526091.1 hypothetical protein [Anaerobiospirillum sp. NML120449]
MEVCQIACQGAYGPYDVPCAAAFTVELGGKSLKSFIIKNEIRFIVFMRG